MRQLKNFWLLLLPLMFMGVAHAQDVHIVYPQEGQDVRGEITARFDGIPAGGYAQVSIDGQFRQATAQNFVVLDTISDRVTFSRADSAYRLDIVVLNAGGKRVGTDSVTFNVANNKVDPEGPAVKLVHWTEQDRLDNRVQRYRVFAESDADISGGASAGGAGGSGGGSSLGGGSGAGAGAASASYIAAPLDWQVSALLRRVVRDTNMMTGSANISTIVQDGFERQRLSESGTGGGADGSSAAPAAPLGKKAAAAAAAAAAVPVKAPWNQDATGGPAWNVAPETGKFYIKMIQQDGTEINATRKATSIAIADLLPTFPTVPVRPGSTWETTMSFVGDLSTRTPINVKAPITFTAYEDIQTPAGENRRCAKLESRFLLPDNLAKRIAANLGNKMGTTGATGAAGGSGSEGGAPSSSSSSSRGGSLGGAGGEGAGAATTLTEDDIEVARTLMVRVIWFDVERRRILRAEDTIHSNFEIPSDTATGGEGSAMPAAAAPSSLPGGLGSGADGGAAAAPAEPTKVDYQLKVTTWMDDRIPPPSRSYVPGGGTAHAHDSVNEPGLTRILGTIPPK